MGKFTGKFHYKRAWRKKGFFLLSSSSPFAFSLCSPLLLLARVFSDDVNGRKSLWKGRTQKRAGWWLSGAGDALTIVNIANTVYWAFLGVWKSTIYDVGRHSSGTSWKIYDCLKLDFSWASTVTATSHFSGKEKTGRASSSEWRSWQQREGAHLSSTEQKWKTHSFSGGQTNSSDKSGRWRAQEFETREKCKFCSWDKRSGAACAHPSHQFQLHSSLIRATVKLLSVCAPNDSHVEADAKFSAVFIPDVDKKFNSEFSCIIFVTVPVSQGKHNAIIWSRALAVGKSSAEKKYVWMSEANSKRREWKWIFVLKRENILRGKLKCSHCSKKKVSIDDFIHFHWLQQLEREKNLNFFSAAFFPFLPQHSAHIFFQHGTFSVTTNNVPLSTTLPREFIQYSAGGGRGKKTKSCQCCGSSPHRSSPNSIENQERKFLILFELLPRSGGEIEKFSLKNFRSTLARDVWEA